MVLIARLTLTLWDMEYTGGTLSAKPLSAKRPLSAKLFRAKFDHPKVQLAQNSVLLPGFLA